MAPWRRQFATSDTFSQSSHTTSRWSTSWSQWGAPPVISVPIFPSLIQEGRATGGYDVMLDQPGRPMFLQFKLSRYIRGHRAREFQQGIFRSSFYRVAFFSSEGKKIEVDERPILCVTEDLSRSEQVPLKEAIIEVASWLTEVSGADLRLDLLESGNFDLTSALCTIGVAFAHRAE